MKHIGPPPATGPAERAGLRGHKIGRSTAYAALAAT